MNEHLGYEKYSRDEDVVNSRNGYKSKKVRSSMGEFEIDVPQDRESQFEPKVIKKRQKDISEIEQKIINMYASGLTNRTIVEEIEDIYGFEVSESMISDITDKVGLYFWWAIDYVRRTYKLLVLKPTLWRFLLTCL